MRIQESESTSLLYYYVAANVLGIERIDPYNRSRQEYKQMQLYPISAYIPAPLFHNMIFMMLRKKRTGGINIIPS